MNRRYTTLILMLLFVSAGAGSCCKERVDNIEKPREKMSISCSLSAIRYLADNAECYAPKWETDARIGIFAAADDDLQSNRCYAARTATVEAVFQSYSESILWNKDAAYRLGAYYPYRSSYTDDTAIEVRIAAEQNGAVNDMSGALATTWWYASTDGVKEADGDVKLTMLPTCGYADIAILTDKNVAGIKSVVVKDCGGSAMAFSKGYLNIATGGVK